VFTHETKTPAVTPAKRLSRGNVPMLRSKPNYQVRQEQADLVALGRGMLFNPRRPWHAAMHFGERVYHPT
jgi:2,4-dienoyl-CoA reductase-like NADH-dependent reductase (Old Yellow Enzyme family)